MTTEEVLSEIKKSPHAFVVWNQDSGEIIRVHHFQKPPCAAEMLECFQTLEALGGSAMGRFLDCRRITPDMLEREAIRCAVVKNRSAILRQWAHDSSIEDLVSILECGEYPVSTGRHDAILILDHLWQLHRDEITTEIRERLRDLIGTAYPLQQDLNDKISVFIAVLDHDVPKLEAMWIDLTRGTISLTMQEWLAEAFAHVGIVEESIVDACIQNMEAVMPFGAKYDAMINLGRFGQKVSRAADVIRRVVYDSEPYVIAGRDRVLERLTTSDREWERCSVCCYGRVHGEKSFVGQPCIECLGIGFVRVGTG